MRQIIPRIQNTVLFGTSTDRWCVAGSGNPLSSTFGAGVGFAPVPWACTFRNIALYCNDPDRTNPMTLTLMKNHAATSLSVTLPAGQTYATNALVDVACDALDFVDYRLTGSSTPFPGHFAAFSIEHEGPGNYFGLATAGTQHAAGAGITGGCFGNGVPGEYIAGVYGGSASICSVPGTITKLAIRDSQTTNSGGSWTAYIKKNNVLQDGSGGTVNTAVTLLDTEAGRRVVGTFSLPVVEGDICEAVAIRNGTTTVFSGVHVSLGIGFMPTNDGWFMLTGGRHISIPGDGATSYAWSGWEGDATESLVTAPIGPIGITARGLYVVRGTLPTGSNGPGTGKTYTHTLLKGTADPYVAGSPTAATVSMADLTSNASINGLSISYPPASSIVIRNESSEDANINVMYWGLQATLGEVEEEEVEPTPGVIGPHQWIVFPRTQPEIDS